MDGEIKCHIGTKISKTTIYDISLMMLNSPVNTS